MNDYLGPPPDPKLAKDMARLEQLLEKRKAENPLQEAQEDLEIIEAVVTQKESRRPKPSLLKKLFRILA